MRDVIAGNGAKIFIFRHKNTQAHQRDREHQLQLEFITGKSAHPVKTRHMQVKALKINKTQGNQKTRKQQKHVRRTPNRNVQTKYSVPQIVNRRGENLRNYRDKYYANSPR